MHSLARCVELLGIGCLTEQSMPELIQIIVSTISQHFERQAERNQKRKDEDYDEGVEDQVIIYFAKMCNTWSPKNFSSTIFPIFRNDFKYLILR